MSKIGTVHVEIKPVLNQEALDGICHQVETAVSDALATATTAPVGWVDDQNRRHAKLDEMQAVAEYDRNVPSNWAHLVDPEVEWGDIRYGRYDTNRVPTGSQYVGWIEDHARSWIVFLGEHGAPSLYWPRRDAQGGVIGSPIELAR